MAATSALPVRLAIALAALAVACDAGPGDRAPSDAPPDALDAATADDLFQADLASPSDAATGDDGNGDAPDVAVGFRISATESRAAGSDGFAFLWVANPPAEEALQVATAAVGPCRFLEPEPAGICDPLCAWPGYCSADNVCRAGLPQRFAGSIAFEGLAANCSLEIERGGDYRWYSDACDPADPSDLFDGGDAIRALATGGDDLPAFSMDTLGVADIASTLPCAGFSLDAGTPLEVAWTPSGQPGDRVRFWLISANHGTQFGHVVCDARDSDGRFVVDAALIGLHLQAFNPVPSWRLERFHETVRVVDGTPVALEARSTTTCNYGR